jgi:hypothetical protein
MIVLDWDRKTEWACYSGDAIGHFGRNELAHFIAELPAGSTVIVEGAHFQPRTALSVAQVYDADELKVLRNVAAENDVAIFLFPEILSFRARAEQNITKDEDTIALYGFINRHPEISLMPWKAQDDAEVSRWEYLNSLRNDCTIRLNMLRPDYTHPSVDAVRKMLDDNFDTLSQPVRDIFGITKKRKLIFNVSRVMSVYVTCFDDKGNLRLNGSGEFIGLRTVWAVLKLHPYHRKAGTARSNLMYHTLRNLEGKIPGNKPVRANFRRGIKDLVQFFRDAG